MAVTVESAAAAEPVSLTLGSSSGPPTPPTPLAFLAESVDVSTMEADLAVLFGDVYTEPDTEPASTGTVSNNILICHELRFTP